MITIFASQTLRLNRHISRRGVCLVLLLLFPRHPMSDVPLDLERARLRAPLSWTDAKSDLLQLCLYLIWCW